MITTNQLAGQFEGGIEMKIKQLFFWLIASLLLIAACSSDDTTSESTRDDSAVDMDMAIEEGEQSQDAATSGLNDNAGNDETSAPRDDLNVEIDVNRKIMYNAFLSLTTKDYETASRFIEEETRAIDGYLINKEIITYENNERQADYTLRIPEPELESFLSTIKSGSVSVNHESISGEDVTDQYVDLETRLNTREQLEARLLEFMEEAESTEDLLAISRDLANVQYEIEQIKGQLTYFDNRINYATVTITLSEENVSTIKEGDLNVWERTKEQWVTSYNAVIVFFSNAFIFIVGNIPALIIFLIVTATIAFFVRRRYKKDKLTKGSSDLKKDDTGTND